MAAKAGLNIFRQARSAENPAVGTAAMAGNNSMK